MRFSKEFFEKIDMLAVIEINNKNDAVPMAKAVSEGGLPVIGVCLTGCGVEAIREITREDCNVYVGAAGVQSLEQAEAALKAGAEFFCESRLNSEIIKWCDKHHIVILEDGCKIVEIPNTLLQARDFFAVKSAAKAAVRKEMGFEFLHVGVNCNNDVEAHNVADRFASLLCMVNNENPNSIFVDEVIEVMKYPFLGRCGHIAFSANNLEKAVGYLGCLGTEPDMDTAIYNNVGKLIVVYLKGEIGGFAVHLKQK